ncbi:MAG: transaldolase [Chromatiales bacterium]|nr:transaldolase [Chromatiales bacterium]
MHEKLAELARQGQSIWLDFIDRKLIESGGLAAMIEQGVTGVTTNPSIFQKAISGSADYDESIRRWQASHPSASTERLLEQLMVEDVTAAADLLRDVWERSGGRDGYVSIEVSPLLAGDAQATVGAAHRLHEAVDRPNLMVKIPATRACVPAIESALSAGINVNVTLLFDVARYRDVLEAHTRALAKVRDPAGLASVASFFVSRIDTSVDAALEAIGSTPALALRGHVAIACAKRAWQEFRAHVSAPDFAALLRRGARVQRLLWGSTGTKNPAYPDTKYVDGLIGRDTVNTLPPATLEAFLDHGKVGPTLDHDAEEARRVISTLQHVGISIAEVTGALQKDGVAAFAAAHRKLIISLEEKRRTLAA